MSGWLTNGMTPATLPLNTSGLIPIDTQAVQGQQPETVAATLSQLAATLGGSVPFQSGRFYGLTAGATPGTLTAVTGTLYAYPVFIPGGATIKTIGLNVTTGQTGGAAHVGLYADNGAGYPGLLVQASDTGALAATAIAAVSNTINLPVQGGLYWLASIFTATGTFPTISSIATGYGNVVNAELGASSVANLVATSADAVTGVSVAATYGTLLSIGTSFPTGAALITNAGVPLVILGT